MYVICKTKLQLKENPDGEVKERTPLYSHSKPSQPTSQREAVENRKTTTNKHDPALNRGWSVHLQANHKHL